MKVNDLIIARNDDMTRWQPAPILCARTEDALAAAGLIARVSSPEENRAAVEAQSAMMTIIREVEVARKRVKEPILDMGRAIDRAAKDAVLPLERETLRIGDLLSAYATKERERAAQEAARIMREQQEAQARVEAERQAAIAIAKTPEEEAAAQARADAEAKAIAERAAIDAEATAAAKAAGQRVGTEWEVTITDLWALARGHPACVTITPRLSEIKALLNSGARVAGVTARKVTKVSVGSKPTLELEA